MDGTTCYHFSIDDVFESLFEAADRGISLWKQPMFAFLAGLHESHGLKVDLYLFVEGVIDGKRRHLRELPDRLRDDFARARDWVRLGPHARDYERAPYQQTAEENRETFRETFEQIDRLAGPEFRSRQVRLHYFSEAYDSADDLLEAGVEGLFLTDKDAVSYHLPPELTRELAGRGEIEYRGLRLIRSHTRLETLVETHPEPPACRAELDRFIEAHGHLVLFTHEIDLARPEVLELARTCFDHLLERQIISI